MKIIYPDGNVTDPELEEILSLSCELRQRVRDISSTGWHPVNTKGEHQRPYPQDR